MKNHPLRLSLDPFAHRFLAGTPIRLMIAADRIGTTPETWARASRH